MSKTTTNINKMTTDELQTLVEKYLPVRESEKNKFGEVFTPTELIREMLGKLPKKIWSDPTLKWLDPANGIGNFPMVAFQMLNDGLSKVAGFKDESKRKKHIIEKMLYMVELNPKNVAMSRKIFGFNANIYCGSFLEDGWKKAFGVEKFDMIMGNPPFNDAKEGGKGQGKGGNDLYPLFVIESINNLSDKGYLTFIHPPKWRAPGKKGNIKKLHDILFKEKQLLYVNIIGFNRTKELFNISGRVDYYILQNKENTKPTEVIDELGEKHLIELNDKPFLPNYAYKEINKILTTKDNGIDVIYSSSIYDTRKLKETKTSDYKYPILHSIKQDGKKIIFFANNRDPKHFGIPKVIIIKGLHPYGYNDFKGEYGMSNYSFGIPIQTSQEGDLILKAINTTVFNFIYQATKWNSGYTEHEMFNYFKPDFYKYFLDKPSTPTHKRAKSLPSKSPIKRKTIKHRAGGRRLKTKRTRKNKKSTRKNTV